MSIKALVLAVDLLVHYLLLVGKVWSVAAPDRRIWPPPGRKSWQYLLTWACFARAFTLNAALLVLDWN